MPTEELENELRSSLARAAADIQDSEQARQRLLQHNYRPGRGHWQTTAGVATGTAAAGVALGLGLTGVLGSAPARDTGAIGASAHHTSTIRTTAFTLVEHANGTATLTINAGVLFEPSTLQRDLRQDGIPALVTSGSFCSSDPAPAGFNQVVTGQKHTDTFTINPAAMPAGTELTFGYFQFSAGQEAAAGLLNASSYSCISTAPTTPPPGADFMVVHITGGPKASSALPLQPKGTTFRPGVMTKHG
jgi:hypothetical protein